MEDYSARKRKALLMNTKTLMSLENRAKKGNLNQSKKKNYMAEYILYDSICIKV